MNYPSLASLILALSLLPWLNACTVIRESTLLAPSRERPVLGLRLRVVEPGSLPQEILGERARVLLVIGVKPQQPAARAGLEKGDLLLSLDGEPVSGMADSVALMQNRRWGEELVLTVLRGGRLQNIPVLLEP